MVTIILLSLTALTAHIMYDMQVLTYNFSFSLFCTIFHSFSKIMHFILITFELHLCHYHTILMPYMNCCCPLLSPRWSLYHHGWTGCRSPPADPSLSLPPISFNTLTQAQTWDNFSYSIPSEGDSDNGRCSIYNLFNFVFSETWIYGKCPMWLRMKDSTLEGMFIRLNTLEGCTLIYCRIYSIKSKWVKSVTVFKSGKTTFPTISALRTISNVGLFTCFTIKGL